MGLFWYLSDCSFKGVRQNKNITYQPQNDSLQKQSLNVFAPKKREKSSHVLVFIHGGSWNSGRKELYTFLGKRLARKGVVAVIIDYPLSPSANYEQMASASAQALIWVKNTIQTYGGDPEKIFVSGHSAGGHLAALISIRNNYFEQLQAANPIKGCILIDAAGLDMYGYLKEENFAQGHTYLQTFTTDPAQWKLASPLYHLRQGMPPLLIYRGEKTYPSIMKSTTKFITELEEYVGKPNYFILKGKKHVPMITQFIWSWNPLYKEIIQFMENQP
jgi:acetyl esterase/lipase